MLGTTKGKLGQCYAGGEKCKVEGWPFKSSPGRWEAQANPDVTGSQKMYICAVKPS